MADGDYERGRRRELDFLAARLKAWRLAAEAARSSGALPPAARKGQKKS